MPIVAACPEGISEEDLEGWYDRFRFYRQPPSREEIVAWIRQFAPEHYPLAKKLLDNVVLISDMDIQLGYRAALTALPGWSLNDQERIGRWAFVGLGGQAESGPAMLHMFREANGLTSDRYQGMFVSISELPALQLTAMDSVIFVDDFAGTGSQFADRWERYQELISSEAHTYLFLAAATSQALARLDEVEDLTVAATRVMGPENNILGEANTYFAAGEKEVVRNYCRIADRRRPSGWGECGLLLVISRKTPNNSLPILHAKAKRWTPIFPRRLQLIAAPPNAAA
ncbi:MAG TPA: hypothetical protein VGA98_00120 [Allosphingosinicella sp.]|jgi:hypothetical protein